MSYTVFTSNQKMAPWADPKTLPPPIHSNLDSETVFVLLESGRIILAWFEHNGQEWVSSTESYPLEETVAGWISPRPSELIEVCERSLSWLTSYQAGGALRFYDEMRAAILKAKGETE